MKKDNIINVENYKENLICSPNYTFKLVYCKFITSTLMLNYVASLKHKIKKKNTNIEIQKVQKKHTHKLILREYCESHIIQKKKKLIEKERRWKKAK